MSDEVIDKLAFDYVLASGNVFSEDNVRAAFTAGFKAASKPLKDGDSYYVCGQKVYTQDYVKALEKKLEEAVGAISFYANPESWDREHTIRYNEIQEDDCADYPHFTRDVRLTGGKRAREFLKKMEGI